MPICHCLPGAQFYHIWLDFVQNVRSCGSNVKVYVVIADIKDAFGSVLHSKLIEILDDLRARLPDKLFIRPESVLVFSNRPNAEGKQMKLIVSTRS